MRYEMLVGMEVLDDVGYQQYREGMMPILSRYGGGFGYDFTVSETLKAEVDHVINRVFTIYFPDQDTQKAFFSDADYLAVKSQFFDKSVGQRTLIASFNT